MNDNSIMRSPGPGGRGHWLDAYMPETQLAVQQPKLIDMAAIRGIVFRQRWLLIGTVVLALVIGLIVTLLATPMYEARSTVRIEPYGTFIVEGQNVEQGIASTQVYDLLSTQMSVIKSRSLAKTVAANLDLGNRPGFLGDVDAQRPPNMTDAKWAETKRDMAAAKLQGGVDASLPENNWIIEIAYHSDDPKIAAEMANAYAAAFVASDTSDTIANNEYAQNVLSEQIDVVRERLREAEEAANLYARNAGIIVQPNLTDEEGRTTTLTASNLGSINDRVAAARAARIAAEQRWRTVQNIPASQLPEVQGNPALQQLLANRAAKQAELAEMRQRYDDQFPQVQTLIAQIGALDSQIGRIASDIKATVRSEYVVALNQERALQSELNSATGDTLAEQDSQVQYGVLQREAQALRDQLQALLTRFNQVSTAANVDSGTINPLDAAVVPTSPYAPSLMRNMGIALVLGFALAAGLAVLRETLDDRIRSFDEVEDKIGLPLLGHTPFVEDRDIETEGANRFSSLMEAYASIRSAIDFAIPRERNVIQLTSSQAGEGKSTTAVILAELFAGVGRKTLLVDADLRRPSVASLLDIEKPKVGLVEVLLGHTDLASAVVGGKHENLDILPIGQVPNNPAELFASSLLRDFIEARREEYSLVIFDSSPILGLADAPMLARLVDGTVFVLEANKVHFGQVRSAIKRLRASGGQPIGAILTKYRALQAGESYGYGYGYYEYGKDL